jgi:hypothetical protein
MTISMVFPGDRKKRGSLRFFLLGGFGPSELVPSELTYMKGAGSANAPSSPIIEWPI